MVLLDVGNTMTRMPWTLGYCTNVHAGTDLESIQQNLKRYAVPARIILHGQPLGVGLWLPAEAARQLQQTGQAERFADWLAQQSLRPYTINGFPYDNFHQDVVKHAVYEPAWWEDARRDYTLTLADVLDRLLPAGQVGSISTLPLGWRSRDVTEAHWRRAAENLHAVADGLHRLEQERGRRIVLAIEPEPGCLLDRAGDVIDFFDRYLHPQTHRRYLTVCHDVCHSAVMFEEQTDVLRRYAAAGLTLGKVQISNAIEVAWGRMSDGRRREAMNQLKEFAEDRYLHQTGRQTEPFQLAEDLPLLVDQDPCRIADQAWRVHFHVPIFLTAIQNLDTTRDAIEECLHRLSDAEAPTFTGHLEVETYAWSVLPESMRRRGLAEDIAAEMTWLKQTIAQNALG